MNTAARNRPLQQNDKDIELSQIEMADKVPQADDTIQKDDVIIAPRKTHLDALSVWQALRVYKRISLLCTMAAMSA